jgi:hypothetical protein
METAGFALRMKIGAPFAYTAGFRAGAGSGAESAAR